MKVKLAKASTFVKTMADKSVSWDWVTYEEEADTKLSNFKLLIANELFNESEKAEREAMVANDTRLNLVIKSEVSGMSVRRA